MQEQIKKSHSYVDQERREDAARSRENQQEMQQTMMSMMMGFGNALSSRFNSGVGGAASGEAGGGYRPYTGSGSNNEDFFGFRDYLYEE